MTARWRKFFPGRAQPGQPSGYTLLRLPLELKALFKEWLLEHAPQKAFARPVPGRAMPWRPALRFGLVNPEDRNRPLCRDARRALRPRLPPPRFFPTHAAGARLRPL